MLAALRRVAPRTLDFVVSSVGWSLPRLDRLVHLLYGALLVFPCRELLTHATEIKGAWSYVLPVALIMSSSVVYELIEWAAAAWFGGDLGMAYLGTQGDEWDGHRDMALASLGAALSMTGAALVSRARAS